MKIKNKYYPIVDTNSPPEIPVVISEPEKKAIYCSTHKKDGMIDVKSKKCIQEGCIVKPCFNWDTEKDPIYCSTHKKDGMIDVTHKRCIQEGCIVRPVFNLETEKKAIYCYTHKKDGMINVVDKTCKSNWCNTTVKNKYEGYCLRCFIHTFPDKPVSRNYKTKEKSVVDYVLQKYQNFTWYSDKKISNGCSRRRPDLLADFGYFVIIVEIDENQHTTYDNSCENKRLMELSQDVGHRPIVFIRFNPDDYTIDNNKITSCWGINGNGICVVKKNKINEWNCRLIKLEEQIDFWSNPVNKSEKTIEQIHLYYDEN